MSIFGSARCEMCEEIYSLRLRGDLSPARMSELQAFASSDPRHDPNNCPACDRSARSREDHSAVGIYAALSASLRPAIPDPNPSEGPTLPVDPCPHSGPASGITANINHVTTSRGFTYDLATLLGEGHYEEEPP